MDFAVRKMMLLLLALCVCQGLAEPPLLSGQYGVPGNFANPQGSQQYVPPLTNSYGAPLGDVSGYGHGGTGGNAGGHHDEHQDYIDSQPKSYEFGYAVKDAASGNDFGRRETSDGETVRGEYRVQLPDGRTQIVTYTADWRTGFHADVRYEGVAQYPDQYNQGYNANANNQGGYDYPTNNNIDAGYNAGGNHGGYNNYQGGGGNSGYNGGGGGYNNYQYGSNSVDGGYSGGSSFAPPPPPAPSSPSSQYGVPFHR
ncbi:pro-resilin-like [Phymastichus coffea]|uniref:pro-resilin-like n=1 Tax=Phymastichus coffea TaxID=108790 RepID=UPI00273CAC3A|nr:pro-resilin-like [Phymastichus coffea]